MSVGIGQGVRNLTGDTDCFADGDLVLAPEAVGQRLAVHVRHGVERHAVHVAGVEQRQDVWVLEMRGDLDLAREPARAQYGREVRFQNLHGNAALELAVARQVDVGHPTAANGSLDLVAVREGPGELSKWLDHFTLARV